MFQPVHAFGGEIRTSATFDVAELHAPLYRLEHASTHAFLKQADRGAWPEHLIVNGLGEKAFDRAALVVEKSLQQQVSGREPVGKLRYPLVDLLFYCIDLGCHRHMQHTLQTNRVLEKSNEALSILSPNGGPLTKPTGSASPLSSTRSIFKAR